VPCLEAPSDKLHRIAQRLDREDFHRLRQERSLNDPVWFHLLELHRGLPGAERPPLRCRMDIRYRLCGTMSQYCTSFINGSEELSQRLAADSLGVTLDSVTRPPLRISGAGNLWGAQGVSRSGRGMGTRNRKYATNA
jgi:hypothetical protein